MTNRKLLSDRWLVAAWWHAGDVESACEALSFDLARHGLGPFPPELLETWNEELQARSEDEDHVRRHQLGRAAVWANAELARRGDERRFRLFGREFEEERAEPPWLLVTPEEHASLIEGSGALARLDVVYDGVMAIADFPPVVDHGIEIEELAPFEARRLANEAIRQGKLEEALRFLPLASEDGDHGVLAELDWIDVLRQLGRRDEARVMWIERAEQWLGGARMVWDTQWKRLAELHIKLKLPEDSRIADIRARASGGT
jgi:hypothetical protein